MAANLLADVDAILDRFDTAALEQTQALHWAPLTALFVVASAWWVKGFCSSS